MSCLKVQKKVNVEIISNLKVTKPDKHVAITIACNNQGKALPKVTIINIHQKLTSRLLETLESLHQSLQNVNVEDQIKRLKL